jgi:tyrosyl-tRNA synthetase
MSQAKDQQLQVFILNKTKSRCARAPAFCFVFPVLGFLNMTVNTDPKKIDEILSRGVLTSILPTKEEFRNKLLSGEKLRFYIGIDATGTAIHLSHAKNFILLEEFRKLGHEVIALMGDFTARIGDPSGRTTARKPLTGEEVTFNAKAIAEQIKPIVSFGDPENPAKLMFNSEWLSNLGFEQILELASNFTVQQIMERDMYQKRLSEGNPIHLHEFLYPIMQGYDSVAMDVDVELCGTDQIFNALAGRTLQKRAHNKDKFVAAVHLMENPKTGELMSKSRGNGVFLNVSAEEMYGQIMSQPDEMMKPLMVNITRISLPEIENLLETKNPRELKGMISFEITKIFHGEEKARQAGEVFVATFANKEFPEDAPTLVVAGGMELGTALVEGGHVESKSEWKRLVEGGGASVRRSVTTEHNQERC